MGTGSSYNTTEIRNIADWFRGEAERLEGAVSSFSAGGAHIDEAFGLLGEAREMAAQYSSAMDDALEGLETAVGALEMGGARLDATAANYETNQQASDMGG